MRPISVNSVLDELRERERQREGDRQRERKREIQICRHPSRDCIDGILKFVDNCDEVVGCKRYMGVIGIEVVAYVKITVMLCSVKITKWGC